MCTAFGLWLGACNAIFGIDDLSYGPTLQQGGGAGAGGETSTTTSTGGEAGGTSTTPFGDYAYRRQLTIEGGSQGGPDEGIPQGYSLSFVLDHAQLVDEGKSRVDGADLRLAQQIGDDWVELHRRLEPSSSWAEVATQIWFMTRNLTADGDGSYWLIYGNPNPPTVLDSPLQVFMHWDEFDGDGSPIWDFDMVGEGSGSSQSGSGMLRVEGTTSLIIGTEDSFAYVHTPMSGDFIADVRIAATGGHVPDWADTGGIMVRQDLDPSSRHVMGSVIPSPNAGAELTQRLADGADSAYATMDVAEPLPGHVQLRRIGDEITVWYSQDGRTWLQVSLPVSMTEPLDDPVLVGIPFSNSDNTAPGWVDVDWFRARLAIQPEPTVTVGDEQPMR